MARNQASQKQIERWEQAVEANEKHLKISAQLQREGLEGLRLAMNSKGEEAVRASREARALLDLGVSMERDAHKELLILERTKPRGAK